MAYLLTNLPTDIRNIIDEKVKELHETDYRKATLKTLADEAVEYMTCYIYEIIGWHTDVLHFAWLEHVGIMDDRDYGSPSDYGIYSLLLENSQAKCETAIEDLNRFVDDFKHLSHLLEDSQTNRFKYL